MLDLEVKQRGFIMRCLLFLPGHTASPTQNFITLRPRTLLTYLKITPCPSFPTSPSKNVLSFFLFLHYSSTDSSVQQSLRLPIFIVLRGFPGGIRGKESTCQCKRRRFDPWVGKIPWRRKWQLTPVFLPGESMNIGAWWATVSGVAKSWIWLSVWAQVVSLTQSLPSSLLLSLIKCLKRISTLWNSLCWGWNTGLKRTQTLWLRNSQFRAHILSRTIGHLRGWTLVLGCQKKKKK